MMKSLLTILLLFCIPLLVSAQITMKGVVKGDQELLIGATVVLYDTSGSIAAYGMTDVEGKYEVIAENIEENYKLEASYFSFTEQSLVIVSADLEKKQITRDFLLKADAQIMEEVVVTSTFIDKDTVTFDLGKLNLDDKDKLRDILDRIPNFSVSDDGAIVYNGKSIDKILVNNNLNFVNQNKIALDNIENGTIEDISVIKNYSDDFEIDFDEIEETVLNIATKSTDNVVVDGSVEAKYGVKDKFQVAGNAFLFSNKLNAFLVNNTNNIGYLDFDVKELTSYLSKNNNLSFFQIDAINRLFVPGEFLEKNFTNNTNLTIRKQGKRVRISALLYYLNSDRTSSSNVAVFSPSNELLASDSLKNRSQIPALLGSASIDFKLTPRTIISYEMKQTIIKDKSQSENKTIVLSDGISNQVIGKNEKEINAGYYSTRIASKWHPKIVFRSDLSLSTEHDNFSNSALVNNSININNQIGTYENRTIKGRTDLKHHTLKHLTNAIKFEYQNIDEGMKFVTDEDSLTKRTINEYLGEIVIDGFDLLEKKLDFDLSFGVNFLDSKVRNTDPLSDFYIPANFSIQYKRKLKTYSVDFERKKRWNDLNVGTDMYTNNNQKINGRNSLASRYSSYEKIGASYSHSDIFTGKTFSAHIGFQLQRGETITTFSNFEEFGTSVYNYLPSKQSKLLNLGVDYSRRISELKYPSIIGLRFDVSRRAFPLVENFQSTTHRTTFSPELSYKTLTKKVLNLKYSSMLNFSLDETKIDLFTSYVSSHSLALILKHKKLKSELSLYYDFGKINNEFFQRKNIDLEVSLSKNKTTFLLDIKHLGELFSIYENNSYNTHSVIENGRNTVITNNQALKYFMLGIKYNF